ncbi:MAG: hypothetical protein ACOX2L_01705 [Anaerolineae bacterium]|nr:erythromycin esterase family protein [Chloroflexota bacterium]
MIDAENRWMPPSPHRERILEALQSGAAHLVDQGHRLPPLLVFEDGGMIPLPRVRLAATRRGPQLVAAEESDSPGMTRFYDVCGSIDEILGQVREGRARDPEEMAGLLRDIGYMVARLGRREEQYRAFLQAVQAAVKAGFAQLPPDAQQAPERLARLGAALGLEGAPPGDVATITSCAEEVRALAQALEDHLARMREVAAEVHRAYQAVRGARNWDEQAPA